MDKNSMVPTNSTLRVSDDKESVCKFFDDFKCNDERVRNIQFFRENPMFSPSASIPTSSTRPGPMPRRPSGSCPL